MDYPKWTARRASDNNLQPFSVSGGPFSQSQMMGWHITDEKGLTVGVSCDSRFTISVNMLSELFFALEKMDALHALSDIHDDGRLDCSDEQWQRVKQVWNFLHELFT